jgi:hypothetical protein
MIGEQSPRRLHFGCQPKCLCLGSGRRGELVISLSRALPNEHFGETNVGLQIILFSIDLHSDVSLTLSHGGYSQSRDRLIHCKGPGRHSAADSERI